MSHQQAQRMYGIGHFARKNEGTIDVEQWTLLDGYSSVEDFWFSLRQLSSFTRAARCIDTGNVCGLLIYEKRRTHFSLINMAVAKPRQGIGTALVHDLVKKLQGNRCAISSYIRETNRPATLFFRKLQFRGALVRDHYGCPTEDAYEMIYRKTRAPIPQNRIAQFLR